MRGRRRPGRGVRRVVTSAAALATVGGMLTARAVAAPAVPNPCSLLTSADVSKALGWKVDSRQSLTAPYRRCDWYGKIPGPVLILQVAPTTEAQFKHAESLAHASRPVTGVGSLAFTVGAGRGLLDVWTNGLVISLAVNPNSD